MSCTSRDVRGELLGLDQEDRTLRRTGAGGLSAVDQLRHLFDAELRYQDGMPSVSDVEERGHNAATCQVRFCCALHDRGPTLPLVDAACRGLARRVRRRHRDCSLRRLRCRPFRRVTDQHSKDLYEHACTPTRLRMHIDGMTCPSREHHVESALRAAGARDVKVDFRRGEARFQAPATIDPMRFVAALAKTPYQPGTPEPAVPETAPQGRHTGRSSGSDRYDLAIVGSGGGAFAAAMTATERGGRVVMIERGTLGGTCVNIVAGNAGDVIYAGVLAVKFHRTVRDLVDTFAPYLTMSEGLKLAAQSFSRDPAKLSCCAS